MWAGQYMEADRPYRFPYYVIHKGNDTLPEEYGIVWMYTKYKMQVIRKVGFSGELNMKTWIPEGKSTAVIRQNLLITGNGEECAWGCVESCLYHISGKRLVRLKSLWQRYMMIKLPARQQSSPARLTDSCRRVHPAALLP